MTFFSLLSLVRFFFLFFISIVEQYSRRKQRLLFQQETSRRGGATSRLFWATELSEREQKKNTHGQSGEIL